jgi:hypothetical protein
MTYFDIGWVKLNVPSCTSCTITAAVIVLVFEAARKCVSARGGFVTPSFEGLRGRAQCDARGANKARNNGQYSSDRWTSMHPAGRLPGRHDPRRELRARPMSGNSRTSSSRLRPLLVFSARAGPIGKGCEGSIALATDR